ncbi:hypothetical protein G7Y89_g8989 [Cudoniella acicularis]|uniref:Uncharacterized protein n=1 Tax=Cudoniella acicularis TaxID=354080 RepID=A0A8H4RFJ1_9HELO|nr:hypothetical protein G7Y89_g8989 [Cudoniella acicularis]
MALLGDSFYEQDQQQQRKIILAYCDSGLVAEECLEGTNYLFLGAAGKGSCDSWLKNAVFPASHPTPELINEVPESRNFRDKQALQDSLCEQKIHNSQSIQTYKLPSPSKRFLGGRKRSVILMWLPETDNELIMEKEASDKEESSAQSENSAATRPEHILDALEFSLEEDVVNEI